MLKLSLSAVDYVILIIYFVIVVAIGALARRAVATSEDFLLAGRSLPAWITGLAFIAANLGALEILGQAANGAQYGLMTAHFYWIGAVPAMVFVGLVMMPFYYGSRVRSVPEYLRLRFNKPTHVFNALTFAVSSVLIAGVNLFALALILEALLGWSLYFSIIVGAVFVGLYITLGGLSGAIYNEVLQFFVILAGLIPLVVVGLYRVGGWHGLTQKIEHPGLGEHTPLYQWGHKAFTLWEGTGSSSTNPLGASWFAIVFGLGFVLSFGYWTTNFAEVQRCLAAKNLSAARRTPLIGAYPKIFIPALTIIPGLIAVVTFPKLGLSGDPNSELAYNKAIPLLMGQFLPSGVLGVAVTGLLAAFMAGMAANVSSFNTVVTYDLWQPYVRRGRSDAYYLNVGRAATIVGIVVGIFTALIASGYNNIMNYIQLLFSVFNAPLFATFIIAMFWKRATPWAGLAGLIAGTVGALVTHLLYTGLILFGGPTLFEPVLHFGSAQDANFWGAIVAFVADAIVTVIVSLVTKPKPESQLRGLVHGLARLDTREEEVPASDRVWFRNPMLLGFTALGLCAVLNVIFY